MFGNLILCVIWKGAVSRRCWTWCLGLCFLGVSWFFNEAQAQLIGNGRQSESIKNVLIQKVSSGELDEATLDRYARLFGISDSELEGLREALRVANEAKQAKVVSQPKENGEKKATPNKEKEPPSEQPDVQPEKPSTPPWERIYGRDFFSKATINFEPRVDVVPPENYRIGRGDQLNVQIWGAHERNYLLDVNAQGALKISRVGMVYVDGLTLHAAQIRIRRALQRIYAGLRSHEQKKKAYLSVSISRVRNLHVHVMGEVEVPGVYTLPAYATLFNALYYAGGPNEKGSLRHVELIRKGKKIAEMDVYRYMSGQVDAADYPSLQDQDIVRIPPYSARVQLKGAFKKQGWYEVKSRESFSDLLAYSGGFSSDAYQKKITLRRNLGDKLVLHTLVDTLYSEFGLQDGDRMIATQVSFIYTNRVQIQGAVFRPGAYALAQAPSVSALVAQAEGLKKEALLSQATLLRRNPDRSWRSFALNLEAILKGEQADMGLESGDSLHVYSLRDLRADEKVFIMGEVHKPGVYVYHKGMVLQELLARAGGLGRFAAHERIEIARFQNATPNTPFQQATLYIHSATPSLDQSYSKKKEFYLKPFDHIFVRKKADLDKESYVVISGQVRYPGAYVLKSSHETIDALIERAGGVRADAHIKGTSLYRPLPDPKRASFPYLQDLKRIRPMDENQLWEADSGLYEEVRIYQAISNRRKRRASPLMLQNGDRIHVPRYPQHVRTRGQVVNPSVFVYDKRWNLLDYVQLSGGYTTRAWKKKAYIRYADGRVSRVRNFLFFKTYPYVEAGAEIYVPNTQARIPIFNPQQAIAITSGLATLSLLIINIINASNN